MVPWSLPSVIYFSRSLTGWPLCWEFSSYLRACSPQGIDSQTTLLLVVSSKNASGIERKRCIQDLASPNKDEGHYIRRLDALFGTFCRAFQSLRCCRSNLLDDFYLPRRAPLSRSAFRFRLGTTKLLFFRFLCPSRPRRQKKSVMWNHTFFRRPWGVEGLITALSFRRRRSSFSIQGLCFTLSSSRCFIFFSLASSIWFDCWKAGSVAICMPFLKGGLFKNLSMPFRKPSNVLLL